MGKILKNVLDRIDELNAQDPNMEEDQPKELLYGKRMTEVLETYEENPSDLLRIACRGQHIKRWTIPREEYPMDRNGYLKWRTQLKIFHGDLLEEIMKEEGYEPDEIKKVKDLIMKKNLRKDPEAQALEDVVCLVFLSYYIDDFAQGKDDDKMIDIIRKTWGKMSERGHQAALKLELSKKVGYLVKEALS